MAQRPPGPGTPGGPQREIPFNRADNRTTVIGVSSGKGGVGKSTTTVNLAAALHARGHKVGVMDADIWGFSIPRMFGFKHGERPNASDDGLILPLNRDGVKVISIGFFLEREEEPMIFRGPILHKALEQFLTDVVWGSDLEYLLIDLPPGTGDISISLSTFLPGMGMVVITTPQPVAAKVAERAANMTGKVKLKVLGVIENMTGEVFGEGGGQLLADIFSVPLYAQIPLDSALREASDAGVPLVWAQPDHEISKKFIDAADQLAKYRPRRRLSISGH